MNIEEAERRRIEEIKEEEKKRAEVSIRRYLFERRTLVAFGRPIVS